MSLYFLKLVYFFLSVNNHSLLQFVQIYALLVRPFYQRGVIELFLVQYIR